MSNTPAVPSQAPQQFQMTVSTPSFNFPAIQGCNAKSTLHDRSKIGRDTLVATGTRVLRESLDTYSAIYKSAVMEFGVSSVPQPNVHKYCATEEEKVSHIVSETFEIIKTIARLRKCKNKIPQTLPSGHYYAQFESLVKAIDSLAINY